MQLLLELFYRKTEQKQIMHAGSCRHLTVQHLVAGYPEHRLASAHKPWSSALVAAANTDVHKLVGHLKRKDLQAGLSTIAVVAH